MTYKKNDWHKSLRKSVLADPEARAEYDAFKLQLDLAQKLKMARQTVHMTQEELLLRA